MSSAALQSGSEQRQNASTIANVTTDPGASLTSGSPLKVSYDTPDSSVSPGPEPRDSKKSRETIAATSGDESDDFYMEGIDDVPERSRSGHANSSPYLDAQGSRSYEEDPEIAPATLAETYLPQLFAQHGPSAIRHLTQYLAINNAKFGELQASKQRRLVVKALELKRGILFEKVGWGRWNQIDARPTDGAPFTPESMPQSMGRNGSLLSTSLKQATRTANSVGFQKPPIMGTYPVPAQQEFMFSPSLSIAETGRDDEDDVDIDPLDLDMEGEDSETDEEDWKGMGVEGLRAKHANNSAVGSYRDSGSFINSYSSQRSVPYPIRRKSSAGVYQMNSPHLPSGSFGHSPSFSRPSFPKTSSYLKSSPMSNARASGFSKAREGRSQQISPTRWAADADAGADAKTSTTQPVDGAQADAVEALVMLAKGRV